MAKVGTTHLKRVLHLTSLNTPYKSLNDIDVSKAHNLVWHKNMTIRPIRDYKLDTAEGEAKLRHVLEHYSKSIWVRHPMARLVSAWNDKLRHGNNAYYLRYGKYIVRQYLKKTPSATIRPLNDLNGTKPTLEEFFKYLNKSVKPFTTTDIHCKLLLNFLLN